MAVCPVNARLLQPHILPPPRGRAMNILCITLGTHQAGEGGAACPETRVPHAGRRQGRLHRQRTPGRQKRPGGGGRARRAGAPPPGGTRGILGGSYQPASPPPPPPHRSSSGRACLLWRRAVGASQLDKRSGPGGPWHDEPHPAPASFVGVCFSAES